MARPASEVRDPTGASALDVTAESAEITGFGR